MPRHSLDPLALVSGLAFCALGIAGLGAWVDIRHSDGDWLTPLVLVLLGMMLFASIVSRSRPARAGAGPDPEPGRPLGDPFGNRAASPLGDRPDQFGNRAGEPLGERPDPFGNRPGEHGVGEVPGSRDP